MKKESKEKRKSRIVGNNMKYYNLIKWAEKLKNKKKKKSLLGKLVCFGNKLDYKKGCFGKCKNIPKRG